MVLIPVLCPHCHSDHVIKGGKTCRGSTTLAQFIAVCRRSKWSKHKTNSPLLALLAMAGSHAACKISSACSNALC